MKQHRLKQEKLDRFNKAIYDIQSLHKSEVAGNLSDYFVVSIDENYFAVWRNNPGNQIKYEVENAIEKFLNTK